MILLLIMLLLLMLLFLLVIVPKSVLLMILLLMMLLFLMLMLLLVIVPATIRATVMGNRVWLYCAMSLPANLKYSFCAHLAILLLVMYGVKFNILLITAVLFC